MILPISKMKITTSKIENARLKKDNTRLKARLAFYGSANMSSSTTSLYNAARKKFRKGPVKRYPEIPGKRSGATRRRMRRRMGAMAAKARMVTTAGTAGRKRPPGSGPLRGMRGYRTATSPSLPCAMRSRPARALAATSD